MRMKLAFSCHSRGMHLSYNAHLDGRRARTTHEPRVMLDTREQYICPGLCAQIQFLGRSEEDSCTRGAGRKLPSEAAD